MGVTVLAASGDSGSTDGSSDGKPDGGFSGFESLRDWVRRALD